LLEPSRCGKVVGSPDSAVHRPQPGPVMDHGGKLETTRPCSSMQLRSPASAHRPSDVRLVDAASGYSRVQLFRADASAELQGARAQHGTVAHLSGIGSSRPGIQTGVGKLSPRTEATPVVLPLAPPLSGIR